MKRILLYLFFIELSLSAGYAQSLEVLQPLQMIENSSVMVQYQNRYGKHNMPDKDIPFPFALICIRLEGSGTEVTAAQQVVDLYMGSQTMVADVERSLVNEIQFLVPTSAKNLFLRCGNGCEEQVLASGTRLRPNTVYYCQVKYTPEEIEYGPKKQKITQQYLVIKVNPPEALVYVDDTLWNVDIMDSIATKKVSLGSHQYKVEMRGYHDKTGTIIVGEKKTNLQVSLNPAFGWLSIPENDETKGAVVYIDNRAAGTIPLLKRRIPSGTHTIQVAKAKYNSFERDFTISDGQVLSFDVKLKPNFANVVLNAVPNAQILIDGENVGTGKWSGTLESGEYVVETQLKHHYPTSYKLKVFPNMDPKPITLPSPLPKLGAIEISSSPQTATIFLDGKDMGKTTPDRLGDVLEGKHTVLLKKTGYLDYSTTVNVKENETSAITATLQSSTIVEISVPDNKRANIYLKASNEDQYKLMGTGTFKGELPVGKYKVKISFTKDYEENYYDLDVSKETHKNYPAPKLGTKSFVISTKPSKGQITIDGGASYSSPQTFTLTYGQHQLRASKYNYQSVDKTIVVGPTTSDMLIKLDRNRSYQETYFCGGIEVAYDNQAVKFAQFKDGQSLDTPLKYNLSGFHFGPDFYIEAQPCGMGLHFGLYYQYLSQYGNYESDDENTEHEATAHEIYAKIEQLNVGKTDKSYDKTQRHSLQVPLELMYSYRKDGDIDGPGFDIHAGALFDFGLSHMVTWYESGTESRINFFAGDNPLLSRYDIKLGGGLDFQWSLFRLGVEYHYGMLNQLHPSLRTGIDPSAGLINNLQSSQLSVRITITYPTNY